MDDTDDLRARVIASDADVRVTRVPALQFPDDRIFASYTLRGVGHFDDARCDRCGSRSDALCRCDAQRRCDGKGYGEDPMKPALLSLVRRVPELRDLAPRYGTHSTVVMHRRGDTRPKAPSSYDIRRATEFRYCSYATVMAYLKAEFPPGFEHLDFTFAFTMMDYDS